MRFISGRGLTIVVLGIVVLTAVPAQLCAIQISGVVFVDSNLDNHPDPGEARLEGIAVSDGHQIVTTDSYGRYQLSFDDDFIVLRLTVPSGYWPTDGRWFVRLEAPGLPSKIIHFPLRSVEQQVPFTFVHVTDIHILRSTAVKVRQFVEEVAAMEPAPIFVVDTGDMVMDSTELGDPRRATELFGIYNEAMSGLPVPLLPVPGNHDHPGFSNPDFPRGNPSFGTTGYERLVGPAYYSLDYAGHHLVAINGTELDGDGVGYHCAMPPDCLAWLRQDMAAMPANQPVILFIHQPAAELANLEQLLEILAGHPVRAIFHGHHHAVKQSQVGGYTQYMGGALSGAWWAGPCLDGSPQGYSIVTITRDGVQATYQALGAMQQVQKSTVNE